MRLQRDKLYAKVFLWNGPSHRTGLDAHAARKSAWMFLRELRNERGFWQEKLAL